MPKLKVLVAMSGGVDSSAAAVLLQKAEYDVTGVYFDLIKKENDPNLLDAKAVCEKIGVPFITFDFKNEFKLNVIDFFIESYKSGVTPNPCVNCNKMIKFGVFMDKALELGFDYIATGHYVRREFDKLNGTFRFKKSLDEKKDQTYFLYNLGQNILKHTLFPVGDKTKNDSRKITMEAGLSIHQKSDSQDICFIPNGDYVGFLENNCTKMPEGNFVDLKGNIIGRHSGLWNYTIGQRKGLGTSFGKTMYVIDLDEKSNTVVLSETENNLLKTTLRANNINWIEKPQFPFLANVKIRYAHKASPAVVTMIDEDTFQVDFIDKQRAITKGQSVVIYDGDYVLGGGVIK